MNANDLKKGRVYFGVRFEDDACTRLLINSYEYIGVNIYGLPSEEEGDQFCFRRMGSEDTLELKEKELKVMLRVDDLVKALKKWASENPALLG